MDWVENEFSAISLGDMRLNARAKKIANSLSQDITGSIPACCGDWHASKAAYRFFSNEKISAEKIFEPHQSKTLQRIKDKDKILLVQDTTELNYSSQTFRKADVKPGYQKNDKIYYLHPLLAITENRLCLGVVDLFTWTRAALKNTSKTKTKAQANSELAHQPIEEKESFRWLLGYRRGCEVAANCPQTQCIVVGDRESDIYDIFHESEHGTSEVKADWLVRVHHNRALMTSLGQRDAEKLFSRLEKSEMICKVSFKLPKQGQRAARQVEQSIKIQQVTLHPPTRKRGHMRLAPVNATILKAEELNPPPDEKPISWILMSNILFETPEEAMILLKWYLCRWEIEVYFKLLKSGCRLEALQLTGEARFKPCIAMYMIIAWRLFYMTMLCRSNPALSCEYVYTKTEWKLVYGLVNKKPPPTSPPTILEMTRWLGQLGGYTNRKSDRPPGIKTLWLGLSRLYQSAATLEALKLMGND